jgi:23S rRNA pseudouridine1911/1915/1917 synthase
LITVTRSITESPTAGSAEEHPVAESDGQTLHVPLALAGSRLDQALATLLPEYSRSRLQQSIKEGAVLVDGRPCRPRDKLMGGETLVARVRMARQADCQPQALDLDIVFEDEHLLVVNKPPGLVVHPAAGNWDGTLQNGLLHHDAALAGLPRSGIVHRLDKDTSGLLVVAKSLRAHTSLVAQLQARSVKRQYLAVIVGTPLVGRTIDAPIGRHATQRTRMAVSPMGKPAITHFQVLEHFRLHSLLQVRLETGRTHQIRVHLAHQRLPIVGDPLYGGRLRLPAQADAAVVDLLRGFARQALHAQRLALLHPRSGELLSWEAPLPEDMRQLLEQLRQDAADH